jgi:hypothetical protein
VETPADRPRPTRVLKSATTKINYKKRKPPASGIAIGVGPSISGGVPAATVNDRIPTDRFDAERLAAR